MYPHISNAKRLARDLALTCDYIEIGDTCYNELVGRKPFYFTKLSPTIYNPDTFEPFKIIWFIYEGREFKLKMSPEFYAELDNCTPTSNMEPFVFKKEDVRFRRSLLVERSVKHTVAEPFGVYQ